MREPMTLLEQSQRQHLYLGRAIRYPPIYPFPKNANAAYIKSKIHSIEDPAIQHIVATGKSIFPYSGRNHLDELPSLSTEKDINHDENQGRRKRKRRSYRKSTYHSSSSNSTQVELPQLTARGTKPDYRTGISISRSDYSVVNLQQHLAPPPSPSNDQIERVLHEPQEKTQSRLPSQKLFKEKQPHASFPLPALKISSLSHRTPTTLSPKEVRSILSEYLQQYY